MTTGSEERLWTYPDLADFPDDAKRRKTIGGRMYVSPVQSPIHQIVLGNVLSPVYRFTENHELGWTCVGPVGVCLSAMDHVEPDLVFIREERTGIIGESAIAGAPDLVAEVASRGTVGRDRGLKRDLYARYGVSGDWSVDSEARQIGVRRVGEEPRRVDDVLRWSPVAGGPVLEITHAEVCDELDKFCSPPSST